MRTPNGNTDVGKTTAVERAEMMTMSRDNSPLTKPGSLG